MIKFLKILPSQMKKLLLIFISLLLVACGSNNSNNNIVTSVLTGKFLDSAVSNLDYKTQTQSGTTNTKGEFNYRAGEIIIFSIGSLDLRSTKATAIITPLTIAATTNINANEVVNIALLLQSLDKDNNHDNGLQITDAAKTRASIMMVIMMVMA